MPGPAAPQEEYGFAAQTAWKKAHPDQPGADVYQQGSRQMTNLSRRYYEQELGALLGATPQGETYGFSEPVRRFIQPEKLGPQVNEIHNQMPSWLPGEDYFMNFRVGDIYSRITEGYMRLPGAGYEARNPELEGVNPEDYPDITKFRILADVAPYSREYENMRERLFKQAQEDTNLQIEYEQIVNQANQIKKSSIQLATRRFTEETETAEGTVKRVGRASVELNEYPGRSFTFSSIGSSTADLSAAVLGEQDNITRSQLVQEVDRRQERFQEFMGDYLKPGTSVTAVTPKDAVAHATEVSSVISAGVAL